MEGLVLVILELVLPLALLLPFLLVGAAALLAGLLSFSSTPAARRTRRAALGVAAAIGLALILAQTIFFEAIVHRLAAAVQERSGIELRFARASGNLYAGRVVLHEAAARRTSDPSSTFDVTLREIEVDVRLPSLFSGDVSIESVRVAGARGSYTRFAAAERPLRRPFVADVLRIEDAEIDWTQKRLDRPDLRIPVKVERLESRPFSARDAALSVLSRSDARGRVAGAAFTLKGDGRRSTWTVEGLSVRVLADFLGEPFDWLSEGAADAIVDGDWSRDKVDLHWRGSLRDPKAAVPERITGLRRTLAEGMVALVNRTPREIPLDFALSLNADGFRGSMSLESLELWDAAAGAVASRLAEAVGLQPESLQNAGRKSLDWIKSKRKK